MWSLQTHVDVESSNQLDWSGTVEGVFREEIGKMADGHRRNSRFMAF